MNKNGIFFLVSLAMSSVPVNAANDAAVKLGQCLYRNCSDQDRELLTQWAFVSLGKTEAARKVAAIPGDKAKNISSRARKRMSEIVSRNCRSEALQAAAGDPKNGLRDSVMVLAGEMLSERFRSDASSLLSSSSLLGEGSGKVSGKLGKLLK